MLRASPSRDLDRRVAEHHLLVIDLGWARPAQGKPIIEGIVITDMPSYIRYLLGLLSQAGLVGN